MENKSLKQILFSIQLILANLVMNSNNYSEKLVNKVNKLLEEIYLYSEEK